MAKGKLSEYSAKRTFTATPEPGPVPVEGRAGPLMFVIQQHSATRLHYDFRIECDGVLMSWAVPKGPSLDPAEKRLAVRTEDHPFDYGSFEGVIPEGQYGAGEVIVWDCGVYSPDEGQQYSFSNRAEAEERVRRELANGKLSFFLRGEKLKGSFALVRTSADPKQWLLLKHKDRFANTGDVLAQSHSVLSGSALDELTPRAPPERVDAGRLAPVGPVEDFPKKLSPMLAELAEGIRTESNWTYEPKLDGYRVLAFIGANGVSLRSRRGLELAPAFPALCAELAAQGVDGMILDGEVVALDELALGVSTRSGIVEGKHGQHEQESEVTPLGLALSIAPFGTPELDADLHDGRLAVGCGFDVGVRDLELYEGPRLDERVPGGAVVGHG